MPVGSGFGGGAATAGAALPELAAGALGVGAEAPEAGVADVDTGAGGTGVPFMSTSAGCVSASSMGT
eukprot:8977498-Alexandrium_andersonii.AAC.1